MRGEGIKAGTEWNRTELIGARLLRNCLFYILNPIDLVFMPSFTLIAILPP